MKKVTIQLVMAILLVMSGIVLLFCGFWIDPAGGVPIKKVKSNSISGSKKENVVQKTEHKSIFKPIIGLLSLLILMYTFFNYIKTKRFPTN